MELPQDVMLNIFSRLPTTSVLRLRYLSKRWLNIVDEEYFRNLHSEQSPPDPFSHGSSSSSSVLFFAIQELEGRTGQRAQILITLSRPGSNVHHVINLGLSEWLEGITSLFVYTPSMSCNGLMCMFPAHTDKSILLCNPLIPECVALPPCTSTRGGRCYSFGFGFSPLSGEYKVVCVFMESLNLDKRGTIKVFTLGAGKPWREVSSEVYYYLWRDRGGLYVDGRIYWVILGPMPNYKFRILSFDVESEEASVIGNAPGTLGCRCSGPHFPFALGCDCRPDFQLAQLGSNHQVSLLINHGSNIEVWALEHKCKCTWNLRHRIKLPHDAPRENFGELLGIQDLGSGAMMILFDDMTLGYDGRTASIGPGPDLPPLREFHFRHMCGDYKPSLVSPKRIARYDESENLMQRFVDCNKKLRLWRPLNTSDGTYLQWPVPPTAAGWSFSYMIKCLYNSWKVLWSLLDRIGDWL